MLINPKNTKRVLDDFGKYVVQQARSNLTKGGIKNTGSLYNSLTYNVSVGKRGGLEFDFFANDYAQFVDKGVKGSKENKKAPESPFKFGNRSKKGGFNEAITKWVINKNITFTTKKGGAMATSSVVFLIKRSIFERGLKTSNFLTKPITAGIKRIDEAIIEAYALDLDFFLKEIVK